jgi:hypothetical protein
MVPLTAPLVWYWWPGEPWDAPEVDPPFAKLVEYDAAASIRATAIAMIVRMNEFSFRGIPIRVDPAPPERGKRMSYIIPVPSPVA